MPGTEDHDLLRPVWLDIGAAATVAIHPVQVEPERLDHVLRHLAGGELDEVTALDLERVVEVDLGALDGGRHDVQRRGHVRALELLAQVRREGREVGSKRRGRRRATGDLVLLVRVPRLSDRLARGGLLGDPTLGGGDQVIADENDLIDQPHLLGLGRLEALHALEQDLHQRARDSDHPHRAGDATSAG